MSYTKYMRFLLGIFVLFIMISSSLAEDQKTNPVVPDQQAIPQNVQQPSTVPETKPQAVPQKNELLKEYTIDVTGKFEFKLLSEFKDVLLQQCPEGSYLMEKQISRNHVVLSIHTAMSTPDLLESAMKKISLKDAGVSVLERDDQKISVRLQ